MKQYSEREKQILEGVIRLVTQTSGLSGITARQIAASAGVGKSTIYDYFSSKNEIIGKAVVYAFEMHTAHLKEKLSQLDSFEERMTAVLWDFLDKSINMSVLYNIVQAFGGVSRVVQEAQSEGFKGEAGRVITEAENLYSSLLQEGQSRGIIRLGRDEDYVRQAFFSVVSGMRSPGRCPCRSKGLEKRVEYAYKMLIKLLN